jgi:hypothetical protein
MTNLSEAELNEIMMYTGMDLLMLVPKWTKLPVIHFCRDTRGVVQFVTILKDINTASTPLCNSQAEEVE